MSVINGVTVADGNNFAPKKKIVRAAEMINGLGQVVGDFVRTKYDLSYHWDELPQSTLTSLLEATDTGTYSDFSVTHPILGGGSYTGTYRVISPLNGQILQYSQAVGSYAWIDATLELEEV